MADTIPTDPFSRRLRELSDNPGAVRAKSTIDRADFYGNNETWIVDTFRLAGGEEVFIQRISAEGAIRLVLPAEVTAAMNRQRDRATTAVRRRGARQALATRRLRGDTIGNPDALAKARSSRGKKGGSR